MKRTREDKRNIKKYDAIVARMHADLYGATGEGHFSERLTRVLALKSMKEVFSTTDDTLLPPEAALCVYHFGYYDNRYQTCFLHSLYDNEERVVEFLDLLEDLNVNIPCENVLFARWREDRTTDQDTLNHVYWERRRPQLLQVLGDIPVGSKMAVQLRKRLDLVAQKTTEPTVILTKDTIADLVSTCQKDGDITPLQRAVQTLERQSTRLTGDVLKDVSVAFRDLKGTFWEVRELVNAIQPGTYPYPIKKPEPAPFLSIGWLKQTFQGQNIPVSTKPESALDVPDQYRSALGKTTKNVEKLDRAIASLYALNRKGGDRSEAIGNFVESIQDYMDSEPGQNLEAKDKILFDYLKATQHGLTGSRAALDYVQSLTEGLASRTIPLKQTLTSTVNAINVTMASQTARSVVSHEGYKDNFYGSIKHMASISEWITKDFALNATSLNDTGASIAADILADAMDIQKVIEDYNKRLVQSGDPTTVINPP